MGAPIPSAAPALGVLHFPPGQPWWVELLSFAVVFSAFEYAAGAAILAATGRRIWDYRERRLNLHGHIDRSRRP